MRIGIVVDDWKLKTFKKCLKDESISFTTTPGPVTGTTAIITEHDDLTTVKKAVEKANTICYRRGGLH